MGIAVSSSAPPNQRPLMLNLGCWHAWQDDAINIDDRLDPGWKERRGWFVKDRMESLEDLFHCDSVDEIRANNVFSGRSYVTVSKMLRSWYQVLKPGAKLRVLFDADATMAFLVGLLREMGYTVIGAESDGRWTTLEATKGGVY